MGFWENEQCEYCSRPIIEKKVDLQRKVGKKYVLIKKVPVGVCKKCGTRYYAANVLKTIESTVSGRRKPEKNPNGRIFAIESRLNAGWFLKVSRQFGKRDRFILLKGYVVMEGLGPTFQGRT